MDIKKDLQKIKDNALKEIKNSKNSDEIENISHIYFGRKEGKINMILKKLKDLSVKDKKEIGSFANEVKVEILESINTKKQELESKDIEEKLSTEWIDITMDIKESEYKNTKGSLHPHTYTRHELEDLFTSLGFTIYQGAELTSDFYNFQALNIPKNHPARDMQDTFYIKDHPNWLMRAHTSEAQIRAVEELGVPLKIIMPGRCYRNENIDARHEHTFYQCDGLVIDENINYCNLKYLLKTVARSLFGVNSEVRFNPKFYPFVEPGFSGEVTCFLCEGKGCHVCKNSGWLEFFGAGMVHPNVLKAGGIDPEKYQGIAFGLGSSRMTMLKYGLDDARLINGGDLRFLKQF